MMRAIGLGLLILLAPQDPADRVRSLVQKLESEEIAEREVAVRDLKRIGTPALPKLREMLPGCKGETHVRVQRVIEHVMAFGTPPLISLKAADRPLREIVADLERQSGIPFRLIGGAADAKVSVAADETIVWKVIEDLCRARGDLMYRFKNDAIEIYPSKFRALPTVDVAGLRFIVDRFIWNQNQFWQNGALLVPPGARVVRINFKLEESVDDLGNDPMKDPRHRMEPIIDGFHAYPGKSKFVYPFWFNRLNGRAPALEAAKIVRCRGQVEVWLAGGERILDGIPEPLGKPSSPAREEVPNLGVTAWRRKEGWLQIHVAASWDEPSVRFLGHKVSPLVILRLKDGSWMTPANWYAQSSLSPNEVRRVDNILNFELPEGAAVSALELVAPHPVVTVEMPFDFRDIPLNAVADRKSDSHAGIASNQVGVRWRKVVDFSGPPTWAAILCFSKTDWGEKDAVMWKELKVIEVKGEDGKELTQIPPEDTAIPGFEPTSPSGAPAPLEVAVKVPQKGAGKISKLRLSVVARVPKERRHYVLADFDTPEKMKTGDEHFDVAIKDADEEWRGYRPEIEIRPKKTPHSELAGLMCTVFYKFEANSGAPSAGGIRFTGIGESTIGTTPYGSLRPMVMRDGQKLRRLFRVEVIIPVELEDRPVTMEYRDIPLK